MKTRQKKIALSKSKSAAHMCHWVELGSQTLLMCTIMMIILYNDDDLLCRSVDNTIDRCFRCVAPTFADLWREFDCTTSSKFFLFAYSQLKSEEKKIQNKIKTILKIKADQKQIGKQTTFKAHWGFFYFILFFFFL